MAAGDLTSVASVKAWLGRSDASADAVLATLVTAVSAAVTSYCRRNFGNGVASYSEIRRGHGSTELVLANTPVAAVQSLTIDQTAIPAQPADGQPGYFIAQPEVISLCSYVFTRGNGYNVRVTYTAGFSAVPADVAQAAIEWVADSYARGQRKDPSLQSKGLSTGGEHFSWKLGPMPDGVKGALDQLRKVVPL